MLLLSVFTFVELNCENLFDCQHDSLKNDTQFLPDGSYHWTRSRYWQKLNRMGQTIISCGERNDGGGTATPWRLPDLVALCEVENDSVMHDLAHRSILRGACYDYIMTSSPDRRGIDVALMYSTFTFRLLSHREAPIRPVKGMSPTRNLLYAEGVMLSGDTMHVIVGHLPSRRGGTAHSRPFRRQVATQIRELIDSVRGRNREAFIIVAGDFNDYADSETLRMVCSDDMEDISAAAKGSNGAHGTYRYKGKWGSLDHIVVSRSLLPKVTGCRIHDAPFLLSDDDKYGGVQPRRNFLGPRYLNGFSDHLPLVAEFCFVTRCLAPSSPSPL